MNSKKEATRKIEFGIFHRQASTQYIHNEYKVPCPKYYYFDCITKIKYNYFDYITNIIITKPMIKIRSPTTPTTIINPTLL